MSFEQQNYLKNVHNCIAAMINVQSKWHPSSVLACAIPFVEFVDLCVCTIRNQSNVDMLAHAPKGLNLMCSIFEETLSDPECYVRWLKLISRQIRVSNRIFGTFVSFNLLFLSSSVWIFVGATPLVPLCDLWE